MELVKLLDEHLSRDSVLTSFRNRTNHYPSQASVKYMHSGYGEEVIKGACVRAMYYRCTGEIQKPFETKTFYTFACGNIFEDYLTEKIKETGTYLDNSVKFFNNDIRLSGEIDVLVRDPDTKELVIVEVKTSAGYYSIKEIAGNKSTQGKPKPAHLLQLLLYLWEFRDQVSKGILFYFDLEKKGRYQFVVRLHKEGGKHYFSIDDKLYKSFAVEDIHDRYREAQGYIDRKELPPADFKKEYTDADVELYYARGELSKTRYENYKRNPEKNPACDWNCSYCGFLDKCKEDDGI